MVSVRLFCLLFDDAVGTRVYLRRVAMSCQGTQAFMPSAADMDQAANGRFPVHTAVKALSIQRDLSQNRRVDGLVDHQPCAAYRPVDGHDALVTDGSRFEERLPALSGVDLHMKATNALAIMDVLGDDQIPDAFGLLELQCKAHPGSAHTGGRIAIQIAHELAKAEKLPLVLLSGKWPRWSMHMPSNRFELRPTEVR